VGAGLVHAYFAQLAGGDAAVLASGDLGHYGEKLSHIGT
jgi:hypothetical protein